MKLFLKIISTALVCSLIFGLLALFGCKKDGGGGDSINPDPPGSDEIAYYKIPDNFWLRLSFSDGTQRNYIKFKGTYQGKSCDIFYSDSGKGYKNEECIVRVAENIYYKYQREYEAGFESEWNKIGGNLDKKAMGKAAFTMFQILFTGSREGNFVSDTINVDGNQVLCKKFSQSGSFGISYYWRPDGFDFWMQCQYYNSSGTLIDITAQKIDLQLSSLPEFVKLPVWN